MGEERTVRILVIEDNPGDVLLTREALRELPVEMIAVNDGDAAIALLESKTFDMAILDLSIRGADGLTVLERYKEATIPIVVFSSSHDEIDANRSVALGAREFVRKPVAWDEYIDAVRGIVERWGAITKDR